MTIKRFNKRNRIIKQPQKLDVTLPTEKSKPSVNLSEYTMLLYGNKKIGKTSFAAQFPDALFLMCEPGGKALEIYQVKVQNWKELNAYVDLAIKSPKFKTIIIDTADYMYDYCFEYMCEKMVIEHPGDEAFGKGWNAIKKEFTKTILKLLHSKKGVIFISHSNASEIKTRRGDSYHKITSSLPGQARGILSAQVDIWMNYTYDDDKRVLFLDGNENIDSGTRAGHRFKYKNGSKITQIDMGKSPEEAYQNFLNAFNNKLEGGKNSTKKSNLLKKKSKLTL